MTIDLEIDEEIDTRDLKGIQLKVLLNEYINIIFPTCENSEIQFLLPTFYSSSL